MFRFGIFLNRFNQLLVKRKPLNHIDGSTATHHINSVSVQVIHYGYDREFVSLGLQPVNKLFCGTVRQSHCRDNNRTGRQLCRLNFSGLDAIRNDRIITGPCQQACHNSPVGCGRIYNENLVHCSGYKI